jgi:hypothetical protein
MEKDQTEQGTADGELGNQDRALDPSYSGSPYFPNVVATRETRVRAEYEDIIYDLFRGDIPDWPPAWQGRENNVVLQVLDGFDPLNDSNFTLSAQVELSGSRINSILDAIGDTGERAIDVGQSYMQAKEYVNENTLSSIQEAAYSEQGVFFIDSQGRRVFHDRHHRLKPPYLTSFATFSNVPVGSEYVVSDGNMIFKRDNLWNHIVVNYGSGEGEFREAFDQASIDRFRQRTLPPLNTILYDPNDAQAFAEGLLARYKDPVLRPDSLLLEPQMDKRLWIQVLTREISDPVTVRLQPPGTPTDTITMDAFIERVEHKWVVGRWATVWRLSPAPSTDYWLLGTHQLGTDTVIGW